MSIIKKLCIATAIAAISGGVAFANGGTMVQPQPGHSFFVGIGGGYSNVEFNHNYSVNQKFSDTGVSIPVGNYSESLNNRVNKLSPTIQAGFLLPINNHNFFFGIEAVDTYLDASTNLQGNYSQNFLFTSIDAKNIRTKVNNLFSVMLLAGTHLNQNNTVTFGVGPAFASIKDSLNLTMTGLNPVTFAPETSRGSFSQSKTVTGITAQVGLQHYFNPKWFLDATYSYSAFGRHTMQGTVTQSLALFGAAAEPQLVTTASDGVRVTVQQVMLSINRKFM